MKIQDYTKEMVDEKSFIDMAYTLLHDKGSTMILLMNLKALVIMNMMKLKTVLYNFILI